MVRSYPEHDQRPVSPDTTVEQDVVKGKWVCVECDLNLKSGLWTLVSPSVYVLLRIL